MGRILRDIFSFGDRPFSERIGFVIFIVIILAFPWIVESCYARAVMIKFLLFALFGLGWNLIGGYGGQVDLGQAKNVGFGAFATALMMSHWNTPFWLTIPAGMIVATAESFAVAYPMFRLRGHYFAIATLCVALVWKELFIFWDWTGGARGIELQVMPGVNFTYMQFDSPIYYHYFIFFLFIAQLLYMNWFRKSKLGYELQAVRDNEEAAASLGINVTLTKVKAYCIAAALGAIGGSFMTVYYLYIDPDLVMPMDLSILIAMTVMVGGAGSIWGPIIGAAILIPLDMYLGAWLGGIGRYGIDFMIYAFIIMIIAAREPRGIWGIIERARRRR
ncbi:MAG: branched-chain amino acid ABC transporter permease [Deltaproteobacteria bacterium]|nr:branched-chain amino acid ABC transporter permease [Deltaproteobacteria bacterium]